MWSSMRLNPRRLRVPSVSQQKAAVMPCRCAAWDVHGRLKAWCSLHLKGEQVKEQKAPLESHRRSSDRNKEEKQRHEQEGLQCPKENGCACYRLKTISLIYLQQHIK